MLLAFACSQIVKQASIIIFRFIFLYWYITHTYPIAIFLSNYRLPFRVMLLKILSVIHEDIFVLVSEIHVVLRMSVRSFMRGVCACRRVSILSNRSEIHRIDCKTMINLLKIRNLIFWQWKLTQWKFELNLQNFLLYLCLF